MMKSVQPVFSLAFRLMFRSKKTLFMSLLALMPVVGAMVAAAAIRFRFGEGAPTGFGMVSQLMSLVYLQFLVLAVTLFYATALIGDEIEDRTLTYLFVRPIPRGIVYLGKYLAGLLVCAILVVPSAVLAFGILTSLDSAEEAWPHAVVLAKDIGVLALGLLAYTSFFGFLGARFKRPLLIGILFSLGWESVITYLPGYIHRFTVMHYLQSLLPHPSGQRGVLALFEQTTSAPVAVATLLLIAGGFLALGCWTVSRREYVLEA